MVTRISRLNCAHSTAFKGLLTAFNGEIWCWKSFNNPTVYSNDDGEDASATPIPLLAPSFSVAPLVMAYLHLDDSGPNNTPLKWGMIF